MIKVQFMNVLHFDILNSCSKTQLICIYIHVKSVREGKLSDKAMATWHQDKLAQLIPWHKVSLTLLVHRKLELKGYIISLLRAPTSINTFTTNL